LLFSKLESIMREKGDEMPKPFPINRGFTLIELMITVSIIGIMMAIAIPNYQKYQAHSKQSEAKTNLASIGTAALAYRAEHDTYLTDWNGLGWAAKGNTRYRYWFNQLSLNPSPYPGIDTTTSGVTDGSYCMAPFATTHCQASQTDYTAVAIGNIDKDPTMDVWEFNGGGRTLNNTQNDIVY